MVFTRVWKHCVAPPPLWRPPCGTPAAMNVRRYVIVEMIAVRLAAPRWQNDEGSAPHTGEAIQPPGPGRRPASRTPHWRHETRRQRGRPELPPVEFAPQIAHVFFFLFQARWGPDRHPFRPDPGQSEERPQQLHNYHPGQRRRHVSTTLFLQYTHILLYPGFKVKPMNLLKPIKTYIWKSNLYFSGQITYITYKNLYFDFALKKHYVELYMGMCLCQITFCVCERN